MRFIFLLRARRGAAALRACSAWLLALGALALMLGALGQPGQAQPLHAAATVPDSLITGTVIWTRADSPYQVLESVTVAASGALTIEAGVTVYFVANAGLFVEGRLAAIGTPTQSITFTLDPGTAQLHNWNGLSFGPESRAELAWCDVSQAGFSAASVPAVTVQSSAVDIHDCHIHHNAGAGVLARGGLAALRLRDTRIEFNDGHGVEVWGGALNPSVERVTLTANRGAAVWQNADVVIPTYHTLTATGNVSDAVVIQGGAMARGALWDFAQTGIPVWVGGYIPANGVVNIAPGTTVHFLPGAVLDIASGAFYALGEAAAPITLTGVTAQPGSWGGVRLMQDTHAILNHCELSYGGQGGYALLTVDSSDVVVQNCRIHHSASDGIGVGAMAPSVTPTLTANQIYSNAVGLRNTGLVTVTALHNWWGDASGPYHPALNPLGLGDPVIGSVRFSPWLTQTPGSAALDIGELALNLYGPEYVAPGETVDYGLFYSNLFTRPISGPLTLRLPPSADYIGNTGGGVYWPARHAVLWEREGLLPGQSGALSARVRYLWGLPDDTIGELVAFASTLHTATLQVNLAYSPTVVTAETPLSAAQFSALSATHAELRVLYTRALGDGLIFLSAARQTLSSGVVITQAVLLNPNDQTVMFLNVTAETALALRVNHTTFTLEDAQGSGVYDPQALRWTQVQGWGAPLMVDSLWPQSAQYSVGKCIGNCVFDAAISLGLGFLKIKAIQTALTAYDCATFLSTLDPKDGLACGAALKGIPGVGEALTILELQQCLTDCKYDPARHGCREDMWVCQAHGYPSQAYQFTCDDTTGELNFSGFVRSCDRDDYKSYRICVNGQGCVEVPKTYPGKNYLWHRDSAVKLAKDPNAKYGAAGDVLPGERMTYTIEFENVGAGTAYGVYIEDALDEALDARTLRTTGGQYLSATRTLLWYVGDVAPQGQPGASGAVTFSVQLKPDLPGGTVVMNRAVVHFPSVPEETPTNVLVNVVQPIAAEPQTVQTGAMQPVSITLRGRDVGNAPLTYTLVASPAYGALRGQPPLLTYAPMDNFVGQDRFAFKVQNAAMDSPPAEVAIVVQPSPFDRQPPVVQWTAPMSGAVGVWASAAPIGRDAVGPVYAPVVIIRFSEALSATTVTTQTARLSDAQGTPLPATVHYDALGRWIKLLPRAPLPGSGTYTGWVSGAVSDASGNPLGAEYTWYFQVALEVHPIYLPLVMKH